MIQRSKRTLPAVIIVLMKICGTRRAIYLLQAWETLYPIVRVLVIPHFGIPLLWLLHHVLHQPRLLLLRLFPIPLQKQLFHRVHKLGDCPGCHCARCCRDYSHWCHCDFVRKTAPPSSPRTSSTCWWLNNIWYLKGRSGSWREIQARFERRKRWTCTGIGRYLASRATSANDHKRVERGHWVTTEENWVATYSSRVI